MRTLTFRLSDSQTNIFIYRYCITITTMKRQFRLTGLGVQNGSVRGTVRVDYENGYGRNMDFKCPLLIFETDEAFENLLIEMEKERDILIKNDKSFELLEKYSNRVFNTDF